MNHSYNPWWVHAVFYELYVDKFGGNFRGAIAHLSYLEELGIDCIHLLPHYPSGGIDDGYDVTNYREVRSELGTLEDFESFIVAAHKKKIRVIIDLVINHVSISHPWFLEALRDPSSEKHKYFLWSEKGTEYSESSNPFYHLKPSNWIFHEELGLSHFSTFYPEQADLNWNEPLIFNEIIDIMDFWIARGVDGFRLDAVTHIVKKDNTKCQHLPETHAIVKRLRAHLNEVNPEVILLGEVNEQYEVAKTYFGDSDECHMVYDFYLSRLLFLSLASGDPTVIARQSLERDTIPKNTQWATFIRNHDDLSLHKLADLDREIIVRTFDQDGVKRFATGIASRQASMLGSSELIIEIFKTLFSISGSPVIYYGDELGMKDQVLESPPTDTRLYCRNTMDWNAVYQLRSADNSILTAVKALIQTYHRDTESISASNQNFVTQVESTVIAVE